MDKRREKRFQAQLRVLLNFGSTYNGRLVDVSPTGMQIRLFSHFKFPHDREIPFSMEKGKSHYQVKGMIRWHRLNVLDRSMSLGVQFTQLDSGFIVDVLKLEYGSPNLPFPCHFTKLDAFLKEYHGNMVHGGLMVQTNGPPPALHKMVYVHLSVPEIRSPLLVRGRVVAQVPGGVGLNLADSEELKSQIQLWLAEQIS